MIARSFAIILLLCAQIAAAQPGAGTFQREAVAAAHPAASDAGAQILAQGGNAVDAAVATSFALAVVRPESCGIGGGGFMVIHLPRDGAEPVQVAINYRECAPEAVGPDFYESLPKGASTRGATAVGVPGTVAGLLHALDRYGTMDRAEVLAPAIKLARDGFEADDHFVGAARGLIGDFAGDTQMQERFAFVLETFLRRGEIQPGDLIRNPAMARCLELIAADGAGAFYDGPIADAIVRAIERDGGPMTRDDLRAFEPREVEPVRFSFAGRSFLGMPPPSSGGVAMAQTLGILERTAFVESAASGLSADSAHLLAEALKHAFADRAEWYGDPDFVDVSVDRLLSDDYLDALAGRIDLRATQPPAAYGSRDAAGALAPPPDDGGTSHLCVVDQWGGAVACTETVNLSFGSLLAVPEFGFVLNNQMDDFTTRRGQANAFGLRQSDRNLPAPRKRPLSSMSPTIALDADGAVIAVAGAAGGPRIITATLQALLNALVFDMTAADALAAARLHHQWSPDRLALTPGWWETETGRAIIASLESRGHDMYKRADLGEAQLIIRRDGAWQAACDATTGSKPAGR
ncbi:MAG: gamma-glutamyltransferase [Phycisphaerales bacterium JB039]